jgi:hypothetical protein
MLDAIRPGVPTGLEVRLRPHSVIAVALLAATLAEGCSSLREIPRGQLADLPEQRDVVVDLRNGAHFDFESARFSADSLWGFRRSETETDIPELSTTPMSLDAVAKVSARKLDWYRTGLSAAGILGVGVAIAVAQHRPGPAGDGTPTKGPPMLTASPKR